MHKLDVITIGRSSVDLYGAQIGGRLEDMISFKKYVGGSPTNIAIGAARLGLRSAVITRVGDEHMGRFIRERLADEGVNVRGVITDPNRLTALVVLGIRDREHFPLIFYRESCADMALTADDIDPDLIADAACVTATGTHLSNPQTEAAVLKALDLARQNHARTALDIDYRPNLWGLAGHNSGEERFITSDEVTQKLQSTLHLFDLIVGTEEEIRIAGGATDTLTALRAIRDLTDAVLICKRGVLGALLFDGDIPGRLEDGIEAPGFPVEVFNVLGAGDGFMAGLLRGWLTGDSWEMALTYANACGALAVSRHGCAPAYPSRHELDWLLEHGSSQRALRKDALLEHIHWATNRTRDWPDLKVFAFDHRSQFADMVAAAGASLDRVAQFKQLCLQAASAVAAGGAGYGILCDERLGGEALYAATGSGLWIGRPVERPGSRPLQLEIGPDFGSDLCEWPAEHVVKVLCYYHPDDPDDIRRGQQETIIRLADAARSNGLELLIELVASSHGPIDDDTFARAVTQIYGCGVKPDWWKLEPTDSAAAWARTCMAIAEADPWCRGIVILGLNKCEADLARVFAAAAGHALVKGFAVGRTIFGDVAPRWLSGTLDDTGAVDEMSRRFRRLCEIWHGAGQAMELSP